MSDPVQRCRTCSRSLGPGGVCAVCLAGDEGDPYELLEELGRGGMGTVWRARDRRLDREVALKFLADEVAGSPGFAERLEREARILARLEHPGIVRLYGVGTMEGAPFLVMERVDGLPLSDVLPLPADRVVELALAVLDALEFAHARGVVHLDLKPSNILLDGEGRPRLADFGIARLTDGSGSAVTQGLQAGTPAFMAPEVFAGGAPNPRMDVYAMGAVLYQALTGQLPLGAFAPTGTALDKVIRRALAPPEARYPDAAAMRADLRAVRAAVDAGDDLPPEERVLARGVALVCTAASGFGLYAFLASVSPRTVAAGELTALVAVTPRPLEDGRVMTQARFETIPILLAVGAAGVAAAAWAMLFQHWRTHGWLREERERPVRAARYVFLAGVFAAGLAALRRSIEAWLGSLVVFAPLVGGSAEVVCLALFWVAVIEARRVGRPLGSEPGIGIGMGLALIPPAVELVRSIRG